MTEPKHLSRVVKLEEGKISISVFTPYTGGEYGEMMGRLRIHTRRHRTSLDLTLSETKRLANALMQITEEIYD